MDKEVEKVGASTKQYLERKFSANVTRINERHKHVSSSFLSHNPIYFYKFPSKSI